MDLGELERWILEHGGRTAPVARRGGETLAAEPLEPQELCRIPFRLILKEERGSPELLAAAEGFSAAPGLLLLTVSLLKEMAKESFWRPYLQVLPKELPQMPALWPESWVQSIKGSHFERQVRARRRGLLWH